MTLDDADLARTWSRDPPLARVDAPLGVPVGPTVARFCPPGTPLARVDPPLCNLVETDAGGARRISCVSTRLLAVERAPERPRCARRERTRGCALKIVVFLTDSPYEATKSGKKIPMDRPPPMWQDHRPLFDTFRMPYTIPGFTERSRSQKEPNDQRLDSPAHASPRQLRLGDRIPHGDTHTTRPRGLNNNIY